MKPAIRKRSDLCGITANRWRLNWYKVNVTQRNETMNSSPRESEDDGDDGERNGETKRSRSLRQDVLGDRLGVYAQEFGAVVCLF